MPVIRHKHEWEHLGGAAFGMYRCDGCGVFAYKMCERTKNEDYDNQIRPYKCAVANCGRSAIAKDAVSVNWQGNKTHQWRCPVHRVHIPVIRYHKSR